MPRKKRASAKVHKGNDKSQHETIAKDILEATSKLSDSAKTGDEQTLEKVFKEWGAQIEPPFFGHALKDAASADQHAMIALILSRVGDKITPADKGLAFRFAAAKGHLGAVKKLLELCLHDIEANDKEAALFLAADRKHADIARELILQCLGDVSQETEHLVLDIFVKNEEINLIDNFLKKLPVADRLSLIQSLFMKPIDDVSSVVYLMLAKEYKDNLVNHMWLRMLKKGASCESDELFNIALKGICEEVDLDDTLEVIEIISNADYPDRVQLLLNNNYARILGFQVGSAFLRAGELEYYDTFIELLTRFYFDLSQKQVADIYNEIKAKKDCPPEIKRLFFEALDWNNKFQHENVFTVCGYYLKALWHKVSGRGKEEENDDLSEDSLSESKQSSVEEPAVPEITLTSAPPTVQFSDPKSTEPTASDKPHETFMVPVRIKP